MEADSTTLDNSSKDGFTEPKLPFTCLPCNFMLYNELTDNSGDKNLEIQIVERLQEFGLIPKNVKCPTNKSDCKLLKKPARVVDKIQWMCQGCGKRQPIRTGSFFLRIQCSILQTLQIILAWCEDADYENAAQHFGVKPKVASMIYDRLEELAIKEQNKYQLGGDGGVVLTEIYPDCMTRLSPDTTDQPHVHRVLMIADTKHVPTHYHLHVTKEDLKKDSSNSLSLKSEIEEVLSQKTLAGSTVVTGSHVPAVESASSIQQLVQYCDVDMQHFLTSRIWRQAVTLCAASRELCAGGGGAGGACAGAVQRYLLAALYRRRHHDHFYRHVLRAIATHYTDDCAHHDTTEQTNDS